MSAKHPHLPLFGVFCAIGLLVFLTFYSVVAFPAFQWRNPKANEMTYYTEFGNVITFQRMEKYQ